MFHRLLVDHYGMICRSSSSRRENRLNRRVYRSHYRISNHSVSIKSRKRRIRSNIERVDRE